MKIVVLKFGGTSVGTIEKIKKVTDIIIEHKKKNKVIIKIYMALIKPRKMLYVALKILIQVLILEILLMMQ